MDEAQKPSNQSWHGLPAHDHGQDARATEAELVGRVRAGEKAVYAELIRRYQDRLRGVLSFYYSSQAEIEEQLQDAFVQAFVQLAHYDPAAPFYPWLRGIALNGLKMEFRRLQTARRRGADYLRYLRLARLEQDPAGAEAEERSAALQHCLDKLPPDEASLLQAKYAENRSVHELAANLQTTVGALKVRLLRLRNALRACIQKQLAQGERA